MIAPRKHVLIIGSGFFLIALISIWVAKVFWPAKDPSSTINSIAYLNTAREVAYVGDKACAECHADYAKKYHQHPMGQSLTRLSALPEEIRKASDRFEAAGRHFEIEFLGDRLVHKMQARGADGKIIAQSKAEIALAIGAGRRGYSFVIEKEGWLTQSPISWFADRQAWGLSPHLSNAVDQPYRPVQVQCLFCHANYVSPVRDSGYRYDQPIIHAESIGCERCHGPGALHVERWTKPHALGEIDETIVNPARLEPKLREAVCQQCHLQGICRIVGQGKEPFDYRPGLALHDFIDVFVWSKEGKDRLRFSSQVEQMQSSQCFVGSNGKLGCISCHDPHELPMPEQRTVYFRARCLKCHEEAGCKLSLPERQAKADSCIDCHMPRLALKNFAHMSVTDHRIPSKQKQVDKTPLPLGSENGILVSFYSDLAKDKGETSSRNLGLALLDLASNPFPMSKRLDLAKKGLPLLSDALTMDPLDAEAWHAKGYGLWLTNRPEMAQEAFETGLKLAPEQWLTLQYAASVAAQMRSFDKAQDYWRRSSRVNPYSYRSHADLARSLANREGWDRAEAEARIALRLDPFQSGARKTLAESLYRQGMQESAKEELVNLIKMHPSLEKEFQAWYKDMERNW
jgi:Tfp pilus assembly protein PilF